MATTGLTKKRGSKSPISKGMDSRILFVYTFLLSLLLSFWISMVRIYTAIHGSVFDLQTPYFFSSMCLKGMNKAVNILWHSLYTCHLSYFVLLQLVYRLVSSQTSQRVLAFTYMPAFQETV